jgi:hypothetical protein
MKTKTITRDELEILYLENSTVDACKILGVTMYMFYKAIDDAGIKRKTKPYREQVALTVTD